MFEKWKMRHGAKNGKMEQFKKYADCGYCIVKKTYSLMAGPHGNPFIELTLAKDNQGSVVFCFTLEEANVAEKYLDAKREIVE